MSITKLEAQVDDMPKDANGMFKYILKQVASENRVSAAFYLRVFMVVGSGRPVALYEAAARLVEEQDYVNSGLPMASEGYGQRIARLTGGLLLPVEDSSDDRFREVMKPILVNVFEFLKRPSVLKNLEQKGLDEMTKEVLSLASAWEQVQPPVEYQLLDELDRFNTVRYGTDPHWLNLTLPFAIFGPVGGHEETFLAIAIEYDLVSYVGEVVRNRPDELFAKKGRPYLDYALRRDRANFRMVRLLLAAGLKPNEPFHVLELAIRAPPLGGDTVWSVFLQHRLVGKTYNTADGDALTDLLLEYGADENIKAKYDQEVANRAAREAFVSH
ncbi:hypothetical protein PG997_006986 [Apiospora hydei]|uniref:Ankyrin repeat domain-containing protein n=1 Tax=Apiospora hydei TaxID=1337664 RepID=A0ABR1WRZ8_9PEZI